MEREIGRKWRDSKTRPTRQETTLPSSAIPDAMVSVCQITIWPAYSGDRLEFGINRRDLPRLLAGAQT